MSYRALSRLDKKPTLIFVHGTPTWSFLYRKLINELSKDYRCIAPDHLGFGLSAKPADAPYRPEDHARNLQTLIEQLNLQDITLVVHDFGGPIGLSYALKEPDNVKALVLFNTWMWSLAGEPALERTSKLIRGPLGKFLYRRLNISPRVLIKALMGDKSKLTRAAHKHYIKVFSRPQDRQAPWVLAQELLGSSAWYDALWQQRERIGDKPTLILWGMKDPTFGERYLERWTGMFSRARVETFPEAGHFVQEESEGLGPIVTEFLGDLP